MYKTIITITLPFASYSRSAHVFYALLGFSLPLSPSPHSPSPSVFIHVHSSRQGVLLISLSSYRVFRISVIYTYCDQTSICMCMTHERNHDNSVAHY